MLINVLFRCPQVPRKINERKFNKRWPQKLSLQKFIQGIHFFHLVAKTLVLLLVVGPRLKSCA